MGEIAFSAEKKTKFPHDNNVLVSFGFNHENFFCHSVVKISLNNQEEIGYLKILHKIFERKAKFDRMLFFLITYDIHRFICVKKSSCANIIW